MDLNVSLMSESLAIVSANEWKINRRVLKQVASNHLSDIDFKEFVKLHKEYAKAP